MTLFYDIRHGELERQRLASAPSLGYDWRKVRGVVGAELGPAVMMLT